MAGYFFICILLQQPVPSGLQFEDGSIIFASDRVTFTVQAAEEVSLHREIIAELWHETGVTATGNAHTFHRRGERFTFEITYPEASLPVGSPVGLNLTTEAGRRDIFKSTIVQVGVPALDKVGLFALIVLLAGLGLLQRRS